MRDPEHDDLFRLRLVDDEIVIDHSDADAGVAEAMGVYSTIKKTAPSGRPADRNAKGQGVLMMRISSVLAVVLLGLLSSCRLSPAVVITVADTNGAPVAGVTATVTSSPGVVLLGKKDTGQTHECVVQTDDEGHVTVAFWPPSAPGFLATLFGARPDDSQWIRVRYVDSGGRVVEQQFSAYAW